MPFTIALIFRPCFLASLSFLSMITPQPSPRPKPSADASNVLHLPSRERELNCESPINPTGDNSRFTPPTTAISHCPFFKLLTAQFSADNEEEQAVLHTIAGPFQS